jgi:hypothetical protein
MRSLLFLFLLASPIAAQPIRVMGPLPPPSDLKPVVSPGRFFAFQPADDSPSYIPSTDAYRVYRVKPGSVYIGVKFDAKADAEPEEYVWPDAKGPVYVLLARNVPGTHTIQLLKNGPADVGPVVNGMPFQLVISGKGPMPPPKPDPVDPPAPKPAGNKAWVVVVEETSMRTPEQIRVLADLKYWQSLSSSGKHLGWRHYDKDSPDIVGKGYFKGDSLPVMMLIDKDGNEIYRGPLPSSTAEIDRIYAEKTGVK